MECGPPSSPTSNGCWSSADLSSSICSPTILVSLINGFGVNVLQRERLGKWEKNDDVASPTKILLLLGVVDWIDAIVHSLRRVLLTRERRHDPVIVDTLGCHWDSIRREEMLDSLICEENHLRVSVRCSTHDWANLINVREIVCIQWMSMGSFGNTCDNRGKDMHILQTDVRRVSMCNPIVWLCQRRVQDYLLHLW
jgi:hypothetical protein